jgi:hypothetical protein
VEAAVGPYRRLLDVWVSRSFGNRLAEETASLHGDDVLEAARGGRPRFGRAHAEAMDRAAEIARAHGFFHWDLELPGAYVETATATWSDDPGFDAVIGRPPSGRDGAPPALRPYLSAAFPRVHGASAEEDAWFWERGLDLARAGGRVGFAVPDRWLRSASAEGLRKLLAEAGELEALVDLRALPVRPHPDVGCIAVVRRPGEGSRRAPAGETRVTLAGADAGAEPALVRYAAAHAYTVPRGRFGAAPWSLERPEVQRLMDRIAAAGVPLREYMGASPAAGIRTGLADAFVIDAPTRDAIVRAHSPAAERIRPLLRAQDIERWSAAWSGHWLIVLPSSEERAWPWTGAPEADAEHLFHRTYPSLHAHLKPWEERLRARHDQGRYWWELRAGADREPHGGARIVHADSAQEPRFAWAAGETCVLSNACVWPTGDLYLLAVANSAVAWTWLWRAALHGRDDALRLTPSAVEALPVAVPHDALRAEIEGAVERLIELTGEKREITGELVDWLRAEYEVSTPDGELLAFAEVNATAFVESVRRLRPRRADPLVPRQVGMLRNAHAELAPRVTAVQAKVAGLERKLWQLVVRAYGLTPEEVQQLAAAAPPRAAAAR